MKIVAVSQRVEVNPGRQERQDVLDQRLLAFLLAAGGLPAPVPNGLFRETADGELNHGTFDAWMSSIKPKAVLLSGGNDIGTRRERDLTEGWLLDYAQNNQLPVLGICRGMQMMGVWSGAKLKPVGGHLCVRHSLQGVISGEVNSYHNFVLVDCPSGFDVLASSEDGEIEAIRHQILPWEGWMWHPEREPAFDSRDLLLLKAVFGV